ncbi:MULTISPECIES: hypothetical protein [unclassified Saccharopolyspora]|uniref:hypothetical protein n=1 Tax=unclassified Saccharopolyspora TaxID=2646250 RepID=UPI001CD2EA16|nr:MULTISPECIES: hypothetical protein [unclassified Saccharopolyspora]MCA1194282.1 hypothetical protein [Saccharopolyspora sp. 6V]MCA1224755.1 hypothetical protein [Saccharopolyspora sp. 6M]MCA1279318.1 hypothetical protein [Saccharopolyspora sp. 7B]
MRRSCAVVALVATALLVYLVMPDPPAAFAGSAVPAAVASSTSAAPTADPAPEVSGGPVFERDDPGDRGPASDGVVVFGREVPPAAAFAVVPAIHCAAPALRAKDVRMSRGAVGIPVPVDPPTPISLGILRC